MKSKVVVTCVGFAVGGLFAWGALFTANVLRTQDMGETIECSCANGPPKCEVRKARSWLGVLYRRSNCNAPS